ncbi:uncharacterized protein DEA37_0000496 [Paragonimus westermani]|uniref:Helicase C-terminal domain-containing protein n=1 Tax=Paragonimus westermani TaxID=34504 RepID=A0A5J4NZF1_9TREM|nr:uncharacterized protein DEA37_0000496 [Paragonimus westermani]
MVTRLQFCLVALCFLQSTAECHRAEINVVIYAGLVLPGSTYCKKHNSIAYFNFYYISPSSMFCRLHLSRFSKIFLFILACLANGVGYHHAGLESTDRQLVEQAFLSGCLPVLASTSTLSIGLNLPAHLVIIKNTEQVINGQLKGYNSTQITQMIGRAGRPQFDTEGVAVIMTSSELKVNPT